jgi:drug/metabolite transporter (DMT)-like permease
MVFVFQDGHLSGLLDFTPLGFVDATLPILMFCTIFGVSMDYEVFLLSRIREAYENGDSNTASVSKGLVATAGIITSAAAIIIVVTGAFAFTGIILTKAVGLGLAVAVLSSIVPNLLGLAALRRVRISTFGIFMSLEPAVAALAGALFLSQGLSAVEAAAIACVVVASAGANSEAAPDAPPPAEP